MQTLRCFIAVPLDEFTRQWLAGIQEELAGEISYRVRWEKPDNFHITLKFLGDVAVSRLDHVLKVVGAISERTRCFTLHPLRLDAFPSPYRPRVLCLRVEDYEGRLRALARDIEERLAEMGFEREARTFKGHITLGRVPKNVRPTPSEEILKSISVRGLEDIEADQIWVMESQLTPQGAIYNALAKYELALE